MTRQLPSDDEIRAALRRHRSSAVVEYLGCLIVLVSTALGVAAAVFAIERLGGFNQLNVNHVRPRTIILLLGGGGLAGFVAGLLVAQVIRLMSASILRRSSSNSRPGNDN